MCWSIIAMKQPIVCFSQLRAFCRNCWPQMFQRFNVVRSLDSLTPRYWILHNYLANITNVITKFLVFVFDMCAYLVSFSSSIFYSMLYLLVSGSYSKIQLSSAVITLSKLSQFFSQSSQMWARVNFWWDLIFRYYICPDFHHAQIFSCNFIRQPVSRFVPVLSAISLSGCLWSSQCASSTFLIAVVLHISAGLPKRGLLARSTLPSPNCLYHL